MRFEVGKTYYAIRNSGNIDVFTITGMKRGLNTACASWGKYVDEYYEDKKIVIKDTHCYQPDLDLIFESEEEALEQGIKILEKKKELLKNPNR